MSAENLPTDDELRAEYQRLDKIKNKMAKIKVTLGCLKCKETKTGELPKDVIAEWLRIHEMATMRWER